MILTTSYFINGHFRNLRAVSGYIPPKSGLKYGSNVPPFWDPGDLRLIYPLVMTNMAMENHHAIHDQKVTIIGDVPSFFNALCKRS